MAETPTVRASSFSTLFQCGLRWYYTHVLELSKPSSGAAHIGTSFHEATAKYDQAVLDGSPIGVSDATGLFVDRLYHPEGDVVWSVDDVSQREAEIVGVRLIASYCRQIAPTREYVAVEMTCPPLTVATEKGHITITGTTDRVRKCLGGLGISDLKSGQGAVDSAGKVKLKGHNLQLGIYSLLAEPELGKPIDGDAEIIGLGLKVKDATAASGYIKNPKLPLIGDEENPGLLELAAGMLNSGVFPPNPKDTLCSPKYCGGYERCIYK